MTDIRYRHLAAAGLILLAVANLALGLALMDPFFLVRVVVGVVLGGLALRFDRWWAVAPALVVGIAMLAETVFFIDYLTHVDTAEFSFGWANIVLGLGVSAFAIADLVARRSRTSGKPVPAFAVQASAIVAAALVVLAITSVIATVAGRDTVGAEEREGALLVTYEDIDIKEDALTANAGELVRIVIDNKDVAYHDFELKAAGIHVELSARESKLVEFTIDTPGSYEYRCTVAGHDDMTGILTIQ